MICNKNHLINIMFKLERGDKPHIFSGVKPLKPFTYCSIEETSFGQVQRVMHITSTSLTGKSTSRRLVEMHFFVHWIKMKLFITLKERCKLQNALRVKVVFNSLKGEFWVAGDGQVIKLQNLCFKFPLKKISCKDREIKKKILQSWSNKKKYQAV